jgi:FHS family L-fucose permease-like MFS transporter
MWSILAVGLFNSIMFPTIFTLAIDGIGELKPKGSGLLCMAIVGGAIIPLACGNLIDLTGFKMAFLLITGCYGYILYYGFINSRKKVSI